MKRYLSDRTSLSYPESRNALYFYWSCVSSYPIDSLVILLFFHRYVNHHWAASPADDFWSETYAAICPRSDSDDFFILMYEYQSVSR